MCDKGSQANNSFQILVFVISCGKIILEYNFISVWTREPTVDFDKRAYFVLDGKTSCVG